MSRRIRVAVSLFIISLLLPWSLQAQVAPRLVEVKRIWDKAPHNAFTDLVRWNNRFYCAFREGKGHADDIGKLRVLVSTDGNAWSSAALLELKEYDLRDAALSVTPENHLMVLGGAQQSTDGQRATGTFVSFSTDGNMFTQPEIVIPKGRWLWRVTWHKDVAYGVAYGAPTNRESSSLLRTTDGKRYETVDSRHLAEGGWPTEARIRFDKAGTAYSLHRRDGQGNTAFLGRSDPPYTSWSWKDLGARLGGPNFLQLPDGTWVGAGRLYDGGARTELVHLDVEAGKITPLLRLPSGGDTSYPGMVWHDDHLWISYYASHEKKTSIYLAKVRFPSLAQPIDITNRRELFVDRHLIERLDGCDLRPHHPTPAESVLRFDKPWEGAFCGYATILKDGDRFRAYYRGLPEAGKDGTDNEVTCCAESNDGVVWTKPNVGVYEVNGSRENNIVLMGETPASHNFSPFLDSNPGARPDRRYKALGGTANGLIAFASVDGLRWSRLQDDPVFTAGVFDSQNVPFYSAAEGKYVCYFRTWTGGGYSGFRSISRTTSTDFVHWSDPVEMTFGDTPPEHLYTNQLSPYFRAPQFAIGVAARFMPGRRVLSKAQAERIGVNPKYFGDISDAVLLSTRGGDRCDRTFMQSFIRPGIGLENWVSRTNYPALGIVPTGENEMSVYVQKNYGQPTSFLQRYTMRLDGFASIHTDYRIGEMLTKPVRFAANDKPGTSTQLHFNAATSAAGSIRIEILDMDGNSLPGYSLDDFDEFIGDQVNHVSTWKGKSSLADLAGKPVRLRFVMKDADLFSVGVGGP